jgi:MFS family permease
MFMIFVMASGLAPNIGAQLTFRFLAAVFGSTPLTCAGGTISDLWSPLEKTYAFPIFAIGGFAGPPLGPVIASYIGVGSIGSWRWTEWMDHSHHGWTGSDHSAPLPDRDVPSSSIEMEGATSSEVNRR